MNLVELARSAIPAAPAIRTATPTESAELRVLIEYVILDAPGEWEWVHRLACADPEAALTCWRTLAADRGLTGSPHTIRTEADYE